MAEARSGFPLDAYDIEALKHQYEILNSKERIEFLKDFHQKGEGVPFEIASLAVRDPVATVRAWSASHLYLDYREYRRKADGGYRFPDRNLSEVVKADSEPFVRASLFENESFFLPVLEEEKYFGNASALERLAIVHRSNIDRDLIKSIVDPNDHTVGIETEERKALILAFLRDRSDTEKARDLAKGFNEAESRAGAPLGFADTTGYALEDLWTLGLKWPEESGLQTLVFKYVNAGDETIEAIYSKCDRPEWRYAMVSNEHHFENYENYHATVSDCALLKLAVFDSDPAVRKTAHQRLNLERSDRETEHAVKKAVYAKDEPAITGLLRNPSLPAPWKKKIAKQFVGLYQREEDWLAATAWRKSRYPRLPEGKPIRWTHDEKISYLWELSAVNTFVSARLTNAL